MEKLKMSLKERIRLEVLGRVMRKEITLVAVADLASTSVRQMRRMWKRYQLDGAGGLVHRLRGMPANNRIEDDQRLAILELYRMLRRRICATGMPACPASISPAAENFTFAWMPLTRG